MDVEESNLETADLDERLLHRWTKKAEEYHQRTPGINKLPLRSVAVIVLLVAVNVIVWIGCGIALYYNRKLVTSALLSWTLGLRHALDADHISAIDLMTRRLVASGDKPVTVGTFFSLGHSTVVTITAIVVAATAEAVSKRFGDISRVGNILGTSVSSAFLIFLGIANAYILYELITEMRKLLKTGSTRILDLDFHGGGWMMSTLKGLFKLVDRPWKMYPIGFLFGLGFDTSSEIALLGLASIEAAQGTSIWLILIFPILFTAGMCLIDTADGSLMMAMYTQTAAARDPFIILYYGIVLTGVTVLVALVIGTIQVMTLIVAVTNASGPFADVIDTLQDNWDIVGGSICGAFIVFGGLSILLYRPTREYVDKRYQLVDEEEIVEDSVDDVGPTDAILVDAS